METSKSELIDQLRAMSGSLRSMLSEESKGISILEMTDRPTDWGRVHICSTLIQMATLVFKITE